MATVFLKPIGLTTAEIGSIDIALCGYGSRSPVAQGPGGSNGVFMDVAFNDLKATGPGNSYTVTLLGNDLIVPAGTYYTFTFRNDNGDILQCNAYIFLGDNTYDLSDYDPFDPTQPPPPLPPLIISQLLVLPSGVWSPDFDGSQYTAWKITLTIDVGGAQFSGLIPGNLYTFIIVQDAVGNHAFTFPAGPPPFGTRNPVEVSQEPNSTTVQTFVCDDNHLLWPIGAGMWSV